MEPTQASRRGGIVRSATAADAAAVAAIYNHHVAGTIVTFEEDPVPVAEMARRIIEVLPAMPWLVWETAGVVAGYAYAAPWKTRSAYRFTAESTVYVDETRVGLGIGRGLYEPLLDDLRDRGFHAVVGVIALPNAASVALHERLGFAKVGHFPAVGWKLGRWIDVGYWQLQLRTGPPS